MFLRCAAPVLTYKTGFELVQQFHAITNPFGIDVHLQVFDLAVGIDDERRIGHAQESWTGTATADRDKGRDLQLRAGRFQFMSDHGTVAGVLDVWIGHVTGVHVITSPVMVGLTRAHRPHDRHVVHLLGHQRHMLGDLHVPAGGDGSEGPPIDATRLEVPDVDRGRSAAHPQQDDCLLVLLQIGGMGLEGRSKIQGRHSQGGSARDMLHEVTTRHTVWRTEIELHAIFSSSWLGTSSLGGRRFFRGAGERPRVPADFRFSAPGSMIQNKLIRV